MKYLLPFLLACTEVSINKIPTNSVDTSTPIVDTTEPSSEPSIEPPEGIGGYVHYYLRQVACPPCVGAPREISVELTAQFHEPVEDSYTSWVMPHGECTEAFSSAVPNVPFINLGQTIKIKSGTTHFEIYHNRDTSSEISCDNRFIVTLLRRHNTHQIGFAFIVCLLFYTNVT